MKRNEVRLTCDCQFSHGIVKAGTLVGVIMMQEPIDPISLLSMIQFSQASIVAVDSEESIKSESVDQELVDEVLDAIESETNLEGLIEDQEQESIEEVEKPTIESDLDELFDDESLIEALKLNDLHTKQSLLDFVAAEKDFNDLKKIGPTRAKKILAGLADWQVKSDQDNTSQE